ncbi:MAG: FG-GAP repeat protein, partial [Magnetococcales bacterium]|nr:FG-GAP repeat protein [Magnetococcales bacterium]
IVSLDSLIGSNGFRLSGIAAGDVTGISVSSSGDVNGDGLDDLIVSAKYGLNANNLDSGVAYVVFGATNLPSLTQIALETLVGPRGFRIDGENSGDLAGFSVSSAGDVNGDGLDDLVIGAIHADHGGTNAGRVYLLYGKSAWSDVVSLGHIIRADGMTFDGDAAHDRTGFRVTGGSDLNGDGFDDLLFGSPATNNTQAPGAVDVFFGGNLTGAVIQGVSPSGHDANHPGDILLGTSEMDSLYGKGGVDVLIGGASDDYLYVSDTTFLRVDGGRGYDALVFERDPNYPNLGAVLDLTESGMLGRIRGIEKIDMRNDQADILIVGNPESLLSITSGLGENGKYGITFIADDADQLILKGDWIKQPVSPGADYASYHDTANRVEIVTGFGLTVTFMPDHVTALNGENGYRLAWDSDGSPLAGYAVSAAGDFNGDGIEDLVIGVPHLTDAQYGGAYVVYGTGTAAHADSVSLAFGLSSGAGYLFVGEDAQQRAGYAVGSLGDINGDGLDDLIIGTYNADTNYAGPGSCYVVFGSTSLPGSAMNLATLNGANGFQLFGAYNGDQLGRSVRGAGDINGDGFDDMIVGAIRYDRPDGQNNDLTSSGAAYVIYGKSGAWNAEESVQTLIGASGTGAFRILGVEKYDYAGVSVASAGDINGDGYADLLIGADYADSVPGNNPDDRYGAAYLVYGKAGGFGSQIDLADLSGGNGFRMMGTAQGDYVGWSVSSAGDVNGDGLDDMLVGAFKAVSNGINLSGAAFVIFGNTDSSAGGVVLPALNGTTGFRISGLGVGDYLGRSVASAGDFNGDGFDDILIGAAGASPAIVAGYHNPGSAYILYGKGSGFASSIDLANLGAHDGFRVEGLGSTQELGYSVSGAGDLNQDGYDDVILGAPGSAPIMVGGSNEASYVLYGGNYTGALPTWSMGFKVLGERAYDYSGKAVSMAGDVNGDGLADVIIGASSNPATPNGNGTGTPGPGAAYVVFGSTANQAFTLDLLQTALDGTDGFKLSGVAASDFTGSAVAGVGDVNGDGYDDMLISATGAKNSSNALSGVSYLFFGRAASAFGAANGAFDLDQLWSSGDGVRLEGGFGDQAGQSVGRAGDINGDGYDDFIIG